MKGRILTALALFFLASCAGRVSFMGSAHIGAGTNCYWTYHPKAQIWSLEGKNFPLNQQNLPQGTPELETQRAEQLSQKIHQVDEQIYRACWRLQRTNDRAEQEQLQAKGQAALEWMKSMRAALAAGDMEQVRLLEGQAEPKQGDVEAPLSD